MSVNWVMLSQTDGFVRLPDELIVRTSPRRTSLHAQAEMAETTSADGGGGGGKTQQFTLDSSTGTAYLTNHRIVYLPATPTPALQSFSAPLLNIHDTHVATPLFGPNVWNATITPVAGGNIPPLAAPLALKLTFKDGGAYDFQTDFEAIKARLVDVIEASGRSPRSVAVGAGPGEINFAAVNTDPLPAYEDASLGAGAAVPGTGAPLPLGVGDAGARRLGPGAELPYVCQPRMPSEAPAYD
ncbi:hypothetical protein KEM52_003807, partial [Ascosphaera acerosa]